MQMYVNYYKKTQMIKEELIKIICDEKELYELVNEAGDKNE